MSVSIDSDLQEAAAQKVQALAVAFPKRFREVSSVSILLEDDHLGRPAFFATLNLRHQQSTMDSFALEMALMQELTKIDPFRHVFVAFTRPPRGPRKKRA